MGGSNHPMFQQCFIAPFIFSPIFSQRAPSWGPPKNAGVAQQAEQLICNQQVDGSIPFASSMIISTLVVDINVHFVFPFIFLLWASGFSAGFCFYKPKTSILLLHYAEGRINK